MRLPNSSVRPSRCIAGPGERLEERPDRYRDERRPHARGQARQDKLSHSSAGTTVRGLLQARVEASSARLEHCYCMLVADVTFKRRLTLDRPSLRLQ
jgi:hypothetical protein